MGSGGIRRVAAIGLGVIALVTAAGARPTPAGALPVSAGGSILAQAASAPTGDSSVDEEQLLQAVDDSLSRKKALDDKVAQLDQQIASTQSDLRNAQNLLDTVETRVEGTQDRLNQVRQQLAATQNSLRQQAIDAYTGRADAGRLAGILLRAGDIGELATQQSYLRVVSATEADLIVQRERLRDDAKGLLLQVTASHAEALDARDAVSQQEAHLQSERDSDANVRYQVTVEIANHNDLLQQVAARKDEFYAQAQDLAAQSQAVTDELRGPSQSSSSSSSSSSSGSSGSSKLADPLPSISINSGFGERVHPIYGYVIMHTGDDLAANSGDPIHAAGDGVVVSAGWMGGYGNATVIDHGGGVATLYGHQSQILVSVGQHVTKGQVIGRVGCTGTCTGPHLHYEVRIDGNPVDPGPYL